MRYIWLVLVAASTEAGPSDPKPDAAAWRAVLVLLEGIRLPLVQRRSHVLGPRALSRTEIHPGRYRGLRWDGRIVIVAIGATGVDYRCVARRWRLRVLPLSFVAGVESMRRVVERRLVLAGHQRIRSSHHLGLGTHLHVLAADQERSICILLEILR